MSLDPASNPEIGQAVVGRSRSDYRGRIDVDHQPRQDGRETSIARCEVSGGRDRFGVHPFPVGMSQLKIFCLSH